jgi:tRNA uridine 5-carboxymethylaminomethyl modification enzyme
MAGINAARRAQGKKPIVLGRDEAYIGVLIDDLVTKGTVEPYRMFTSRAEYRLLLRQDNADRRLSQLGRDIGLLPERNYANFAVKCAAIDREKARLQSTRSGTTTLAQMLRRPEVTYGDLPDRDASLSAEVIQQVEIDLKYEGYIQRQETDVERTKSLDDKQIPSWIDYEAVHSLRKEARQKLGKIRPATIGQASRISGVTPSDISILLVRMKGGPEQGSVPTVDDSAPL